MLITFAESMFAEWHRGYDQTTIRFR